jgi:hypothetical protein
MDAAELAVAYGLTPGVSVARPEKLKLTGSLVRSKIVDRSSPIVYGYSEAPALYSFDGPIFNVSNLAGGRGGRRRGSDDRQRPTGPGPADDAHRPTGRIFAEARGAQVVPWPRGRPSCSSPPARPRSPWPPRRAA